MEKTTMLRISAILAGSLLSATLAWAAADYSAMSNEELAAKHDSMQKAPMEEQHAFHSEWQKRLQKMSPEEKQKTKASQGNGSGGGMGGGKGSGSGGMGGGMGSGSGGGMGGMGGGMGGSGRH